MPAHPQSQHISPAIVSDWKLVVSQPRPRRGTPAGANWRPPCWRTRILGVTFQYGWFPTGALDFGPHRPNLTAGAWQLWSDYGTRDLPEFMSLLVGCRHRQEAQQLAERIIHDYFAQRRCQLLEQAKAITSQPLGRQLPLELVAP